ncbi:MAG: nucleotide exchange factor GrpE, partial [Patescibacteria group bacterium]
MTDPKQPAPKQPPAHAKPAAQQSQGKPEPNVQDLQKQVARLIDIAARAQADLQNFKMRMERDAAELRFFIQSDLLLKILPVLDDLYRAMSHASSQDGLEQIAKKLEKILWDAGVKKIEAIGALFDPLRHEIVNTGPGEKDIKIAVNEEGYELHGKV